MTEAQVARSAVAGADVHYGGFWRRFIAFIVDWFLVSSAVAIVFLLLAAVFPAIGNSIVLRTPLDIGVTERTIESKTVDGRDGNVAIKTTEKIVEETVLGTWTYFFRVIEVQAGVVVRLRHLAHVEDHARRGSIRRPARRSRARTSRTSSCSRC